MAGPTKGRADPKDERWFPKKGEPFHPHPNVWRRKGFSTEPAKQGSTGTARPAPPVPPAIIPGVQPALQPVILAFFAFIFVILNNFIGIIAVLIGIILAFLGLRIALQQRAVEITMWTNVGMMFNAIVLLAGVLVVINPGPNPCFGGCFTTTISNGGGCDSFGQVHGCNAICNTGADNTCHCEYSPGLGIPVPTCSSNADCRNQDTLCSTSGICIWAAGGPQC